MSAARCANPPRWLGDSPSGLGDTSLRASTSTARTGRLHLPDHLLSAVTPYFSDPVKTSLLGNVEHDDPVLDADGEGPHGEVGRQRQRAAGVKVELRAVARADRDAVLVVPVALAERAVVMGAAIL